MLLSVLALGVLALGGSALGCGTPAEASGRRVFLPPYAVDPDEPNTLLIREDIVAKLATGEASSSDTEAEIVGFGRVGFAADASYAVSVPFNSLVERVLVNIGDAVEPGTPLAELRSSELARVRAEETNALVQVRVQTQALERLRPLLADGTATDREVAEAEAALDVARAELASARQALEAAGARRGRGDRYTLRATSRGHVLERTIAPGERVGDDADQPAFLIGDPESLVVRASFPERDTAWLREGASCRFTVHALHGRTYEGVVARVVRAVDPATRSAVGYCQPSTHDPDLRAEMIARVHVVVRGTDHVVVPRSALALHRDAWVLFVRTAEDKLERRRVEPGLTLGDQVQIVRGVEAGERVVTEGVVLLDGELDVLL